MPTTRSASAGAGALLFGLSAEPTTLFIERALDVSADDLAELEDGRIGDRVIRGVPALLPPDQAMRQQGSQVLGDIRLRAAGGLDESRYRAFPVRQLVQNLQPKRHSEDSEPRGDRTEILGVEGGLGHRSPSITQFFMKITT